MKGKHGGGGFEVIRRNPAGGVNVALVDVKGKQRPASRQVRFVEGPKLFHGSARAELEARPLRRLPENVAREAIGRSLRIKSVQPDVSAEISRSLHEVA